MLLFIVTLEVTLMMAFIQVCTLFSWSVMAVDVIFLPIILLTTIIFTVVSYKIGQGGKNIKINKEDKEIYRDDDKNWILGNFYYNKKDPSIFIEKRVGIGWDVNLGNPIGLIIMILPLVLVIAIIINLIIMGV